MMSLPFTHVGRGSWSLSCHNPTSSAWLWRKHRPAGYTSRNMSKQGRAGRTHDNNFCHSGAKVLNDLTSASTSPFAVHFSSLISLSSTSAAIQIKAENVLSAPDIARGLCQGKENT